MSVQYDVVVNFSSTGDIAGGFEKGLAKAKSSSGAFASDFANSFNSAFDSVASTAIGAFTKVAAIGGAAVAAGLTKAVKEGLDFGSYKESLAAGIGTTQTMLGGGDFGANLTGANDSMENLRKLALKLPGEFKDAANAFSYIMPAGIEHGMKRGDMETMAAKSVAAAAALGVNQATAGHELAGMLEGRATGRMPLFAKMGLGSAKEWNHLGFDEKTAKINERFNRLDPAIEHYSGTMAGLTSAASDEAKNLASVLAAPLAGSIKAELGRALAWLGNNRAGVEAFVTNIGVGLDRAFHFALDAIREWGPPVLTFVRTIEGGLERAFTRVAPYLDKFEGVAKHFLQDPKAFDKIAGAVGGLVALRAGTGAAEMGLGGVASLMPMLKSAGIGAGELGAALPLATAAALALGVAVDGAASALADPASPFHGVMVDSTARTAAHAEHLGHELLGTADATKTLREALGFGLAANVEGFTSLLDNGVTAVSGFNSSLTEAQLKLGAFAMSVAGYMKDTPITVDHELPPVRPFSPNTGGGAEPEVEAKIVPPKTNINIAQMTIKVAAEGEDPDRIAGRVFDKFADAVKNPKSSPDDIRTAPWRGRGL